MTPHALLTAAYAAFNRRDIDAALALMTPAVIWPRASESGRVTGKDAIRAYWTRQWAEFNPHVSPLTITLDPNNPNHATVQVHQIVRNLHGDLLADSVVIHTYTLQNGLIDRMDLPDDNPFPTNPS